MTHSHQNRIWCERAEPRSTERHTPEVWARKAPLHVRAAAPPARTELVFELLEVAIHTILYARDVYPRALFEERRAFGVRAAMSRHPDLNEYIADVLRSAKPLMDAGAMTKLVVVIAGADDAPAEPVFDLARAARRRRRRGRRRARAGARARAWSVDDAAPRGGGSLLLKLATWRARAAARRALPPVVYTDTPRRRRGRGAQARARAWAASAAPTAASASSTRARSRASSRSARARPRRA